MEEWKFPTLLDTVYVVYVCIGTVDCGDAENHIPSMKHLETSELSKPRLQKTL
jgi:hypothetical protein